MTSPFSKIKLNFNIGSTLPWSQRKAILGQEVALEKRSPKRIIKSLKKFLPLILVIFLAFIAYTFISKLGSSAKTNNVTSSDSTRYQLQAPKASQTLNKEFSFPLNDSKGKEISKLIYVLETADMQDEILIKGQKATAVEGRTFLILNLKIKNDHNQNVSINTKDYIRLGAGENPSEWLAPDIHNDPVEVQAISTKFTRLAFPIDDNSDQFKLQVGEINGEKTLVDLGFK